MSLGIFPPAHSVSKKTGGFIDRFPCFDPIISAQDARRDWRPPAIWEKNTAFYI
jgi:hypothetical protein